jgi:hypothetical protein
MGMANIQNDSEPVTFSALLGVRIAFLVLRILALIVLTLVAFRTLIFLMSNFGTGVAIEQYGLNVFAKMVQSWHP